MRESPQHINQKLYVADLLTDAIGGGVRIWCEGYNYLTILTDGYFNPWIPFQYNNMTHPNGLFLTLHPSTQIIDIYKEYLDIPIKNDKYFDWNNYPNPTDNGTVENGFNHIYFYLTKYPFSQTVDKPDGFQWEKSFQVLAGLLGVYHFGINRINNTNVLAIPFIPDCFNKLVYLYTESNASQVAQFTFLFEDGTTHNVALVTDTLTEILMPCKRFILHVQANAVSATDFDIMLKFEKA